MCSRTIDLRAEIHLVGQQPRPRLLASIDDASHGRRRQDRAGRVIRIRQIEEAGLWRDGVLELLPVRLPAFVRPQSKGPHVRTEASRHAPHLHVVGQLHRDHVAGLNLAERDQVVCFRRAVGDLDLVDAGAVVERRDPLAQLDGAVRLAVAERFDRGRPRGRIPSLSARAA